MHAVEKVFWLRNRENVSTIVRALSLSLLVKESERERERAREKKRHIPPVDILAAKASYESAYTGFRDGEASEDKGGKTVGSCDRVEERGGEGREGGREGDHEGVRTCA